MSTHPPHKLYQFETSDAVSFGDLEFKNDASYSAFGSTELLDRSCVKAVDSAAATEFVSARAAERPLAAQTLPAENDFDNQYPWCLNCFPTVRELTRHLVDELNRVDRTPRDWRRSEVITNIFLLSCTITDTIDDFLAGNNYDFSRIGKTAPFANLAVKGIDKFFDLAGRLRRSEERRVGKECSAGCGGCHEKEI